MAQSQRNEHYDRVYEVALRLFVNVISNSPEMSLKASDKVAVRCTKIAYTFEMAFSDTFSECTENMTYEDERATDGKASPW
jgi:hypothetical protein